MASFNDSEVLAQEPQSWRPGPTTRIIAVVILVLGAVAVLADREARAEESAALSECSHTIDAAIESALAPVESMMAYVRVTRDAARPALRQDLDAMVAGQAVNASRHLDPVKSACASIRVLGHHAALKELRLACLARLDQAADYLAAVANNGSVAFGARAVDRNSADC